MMHGKMPQIDFKEKPFLAIWETTHACDLACLHCRASADPNPDPDELTHEEGKKLIRDVHELGTPILVFSGGDPLKRKRLPELISYAKSFKIRTGAIPAVTPLLTEARVKELKKAGLDQIAFSLDAASAEEHDAFRRVKGVFDQTLKFVQIANEQGLATQLNSLINLHNEKQLDDLIRLVESLDIVFWEVFFLVPVGRGKELELMDKNKFEEAFAKIYQLSKRAKFIIKITEAPHYRRYYMEQETIREKVDENGFIRMGGRQMPAYLRQPEGPKGSIGRAPSGVNSGKGFLFISHKGDVMPSGFLPIAAGNIREKSLKEIYQNAPMMQELRDPSLLKGRCGICPYAEICGGSRSRAYALTGDYLEEDPTCSYNPFGALRAKSEPANPSQSQPIPL